MAKKRNSSSRLVIIVSSLVFLGVMLALIAADLLLTKNSNIDNTSSTTSSSSLLAKPLSVSDIDIYQLWSLTNKTRADAGLNPLVLNEKLNNSALAKCNDMVAKDYWSHNNPSGQTPWHFITDQGIPYIHLAENQAAGFDNSNAVMNGLLESPEHKANILDPKFTDVGFGVCKSSSFVGVEGDPALIVVEHFAQI